MNDTWNELESVRELTEGQLCDRIKYIEQLKDELTAEQWAINWKSEYEVACMEIRRRHLSKI